MKKLLIILLALALLIPFTGCEKQPDEYFLYPLGSYLGYEIGMPYFGSGYNQEYIDETAPQTVSIQVQGTSIELTYEDTWKFYDGFVVNRYDGANFYADGRLRGYHNYDYYSYLKDQHTIGPEE